MSPYRTPSKPAETAQVYQTSCPSCAILVRYTAADVRQQQAIGVPYILCPWCKAYVERFVWNKGA